MHLRNFLNGGVAEQAGKESCIMTNRRVHRIPRSRVLLRNKYADFFQRLGSYLDNYKTKADAAKEMNTDKTSFKNDDAISELKS